MGWRAHRWRLYGLALRETARAPGLWLRRKMHGLRWRVPSPERLLFAPQDLRTSDPTVAQDIFGGLFAFADGQVEARGRSPFDLAPPSAAWARALHGFGWLRHLRAADSAQAREGGRQLVADALGPRRREIERGIGRETRVVARRVISFLCQSPLVLNGADRAFYGVFLRAIGRGVAVLEADVATARDPHDRLVAAIALSYAALCCSGFENRLRRATRLLSDELGAQILADGGHVSRNPGVLVGLLLDLLPLRLLYASRSLEAPEALGRAVDRMMPMLRYLRGPGNELALFNGMGATPVDQIATLFSYDSVRAPPPSYADASGYLRLEAGGTVLLADTGGAPPPDSAAAAHAGCLSFELSTDGAPLVVNCGTPASHPALSQASRRTAAHSTVSVGATSSGLFLDEAGGVVAPWLARRLGPVMAAGPREVLVDKGTGPDAGLSCTARHDGYAASCGLTHERRWILFPDGGRLDGEDTLAAAGGQPPPVDAVLRFHLHPAVSPHQTEDGRIELSARRGSAWRFSCESAAATIEASIYHGGPAGRRPCRQIVVPFPPIPNPTVRWRFERIAADPRPGPDPGRDAASASHTSP